MGQSEDESALLALRAGPSGRRTRWPTHLYNRAMNTSRPLRRSRNNRMIAGVVGGFAEHFGLDPTLARIIYVLVSVFSAAFPGILVYILFWILVPQGE
jgi:phage shock protein PspC (stress-responsive transcriptional regulator)